jgi:hypothetical protein
MHELYFKHNFPFHLISNKKQRRGIEKFGRMYPINTFRLTLAWFMLNYIINSLENDIPSIHQHDLCIKIELPYNRRRRRRRNCFILKWKKLHLHTIIKGEKKGAIMDYIWSIISVQSSYRWVFEKPLLRTDLALDSWPSWIMKAFPNIVAKFTFNPREACPLQN